jgi:hypothetical protein
MDGQPVLAITGLQFHDLIGTFTQQDVELDRLYMDVAGSMSGSWVRHTHNCPDTARGNTGLKAGGTKEGGKPEGRDNGTPDGGKAPFDQPTLKPNWGKLTVRNFWLRSSVASDSAGFERGAQGGRTIPGLRAQPPENQRSMFPLFRKHSAPNAALLFTSGPVGGEAIGEYRGEPLYHGSLDGQEYTELLAQNR